MPIASNPNTAIDHPTRALRLALIAACSAFGGFFGVLLAMHWHSRLLFAPAVACVVVGVPVGIVAIGYGWWSILARRRR
jgi:hypothetical protein